MTVMSTGYRLGEPLTVNCTSQPSPSPPTLTFYVNNRAVSQLAVINRCQHCVGMEGNKQLTLLLLVTIKLCLKREMNYVNANSKCYIFDLAICFNLRVSSSGQFIK